MPKPKLPVIEQGMPIPARSKWQPVVDAMNSGDSVVLTTSETSAFRTCARIAGIKVVSRTIQPNQVRVWRV